MVSSLTFVSWQGSPRTKAEGRSDNRLHLAACCPSPALALRCSRQPSMRGTQGTGAAVVALWEAPHGRVQEGVAEKVTGPNMGPAWGGG